MHRFILAVFLVGSFLVGHRSIELYDRLQHLIDYVKIHPDSQQPDLMLGIYLSEAQLITMQSNGSDHRTKLTKLLESMKNIREQFENQVNEAEICESNVHNSIAVRHLLNLHFWVTSLQINNEPLFFGNLTTKQPLSMTFENFADLIDVGAPSPTESDECLAEVLNSIHCTVSARCLQKMSSDDESHGYHLTHKLLYFMLVKYRDCGQCLPADGKSLDFMIYSLCAMVWHERNLIIKMEIPNALKDLFLEQTLLCGMSGYAAFIDESTATQITQWQVEASGCFEYFDGGLPSDNSSTRLKRHAVLLYGNCSDHMTGLASATFSLFATVTNYFYNDMF